MIDAGLLPEELLLLPVLSLAAGVELYLTLAVLYLGPIAGWLNGVPGDFSSAGSAWAVSVAAILYALELALETRPLPALLWHVVQTVARPVAGALVGVSLLGPYGTAAGVLGGAVGAGLAWYAHAIKRGLDVQRWLARQTTPARYLISTLEDVLVLGLVFLALERPAAGGGTAVVLLATCLVVGRPLLTAAKLGLRLVWDRAWSLHLREGWRTGEDIPAAIRETWARRGAGPDEGLRGFSAAALDLPGRPGLSTGWLLSGGRGAAFAVPGGGDVQLFRLDAHGKIEVEPGLLADRLHLSRPEEERTTLVLSKRAPSGPAVVGEVRPTPSGNPPPDRGYRVRRK